MGQNAIACILSARDEGGDFKSLADFCDRVDLRAINRRTVESLIQCGAFDKIESNRHQLIRDLELVYDWAQSRAKDRAIGQGNLFDYLGTSNTTSKQTGNNSFETVPKAEPVADFMPQEKLRMEKELLGFYVSDHPLKSLKPAASLLTPINLSQFKEQTKDTKVCAVVMLNNVKKVMTKKGDQMAILQIEDLTGQSEAVVFAKTYERISDQLEVDARLIVWGKVDRRDDQNQLIVEDIEKVEQVQMVMVELNPQQVSDIQTMHNLRTILQEHTGDKERAKIPVVGIIQSETARELVRFGWQYCVQDSGSTVEALKNARFNADVKSLTGS